MILQNWDILTATVGNDACLEHCCFQAKNNFPSMVPLIKREISNNYSHFFPLLSNNLNKLNVKYLSTTGIT